MVLWIPEQRIVWPRDGLNVVGVLGGLLAFNAQRIGPKSRLTVSLPPPAVSASPRAGSVAFSVDSAGELVALLKSHCFDLIG